MATVTIYQWHLYEIDTDSMRRSRRWATRQAAEGFGGEVIEATAVDVDSSVVGSEIEGMTEIGFDPNRRSTNFQSSLGNTPEKITYDPHGERASNYDPHGNVQS